MSRRFDLSNFSGPGEFRQAVQYVSLPFCLATSKIMKKYELTFEEACDFLEDKGYLSWSGTTPIYNLAGDKLWREKEEKKLPKKATPKKEPVSIYTPDTKIHCNFFTLVARNKSLNTNYSGGHKAFVGRYFSEYNDDITTLIAMSAHELIEPGDDLIDQGLVARIDFHFFDAFVCCMVPPFEDDPSPITDLSGNDIGVNWLNGLCTDKGGCFIWLAK